MLEEMGICGKVRDRVGMLAEGVAALLMLHDGGIFKVGDAFATRFYPNCLPRKVHLGGIDARLPRPACDCTAARDWSLGVWMESSCPVSMESGVRRQGRDGSTGLLHSEGRTRKDQQSCLTMFNCMYVAYTNILESSSYINHYIITAYVCARKSTATTLAF